MSNLGAYQWATTHAKKVGGMEYLLAGFTAFGAAISAIVICSVGRIAKSVNTKTKEAPYAEYCVTSEGVSNEGLKFDVGDRFEVLERDGVAVLIEKHGDDNNPYFVSAEFLKTISNYMINRGK